MILITDYDPKTEAEFQKKLQDYLGPEDYNSYKLADSKNQELWKTYHDQNWITTEKIYEEIFIPEYNDSFLFLSKLKTIVSPGVSPSQLLIHPEYSAWLTKLPTDLQPIGVESIIFED